MLLLVLGLCHAALRGMRHPERSKVCLNVCLKSNPLPQRKHRGRQRCCPGSAPALAIDAAAQRRELRLPKQKQSPKLDLPSSGAEGREAAGGEELEGGKGRRAVRQEGRFGVETEFLVRASRADFQCLFYLFS